MAEKQSEKSILDILSFDAVTAGSRGDRNRPYMPETI